MPRGSAHWQLMSMLSSPMIRVRQPGSGTPARLRGGLGLYETCRTFACGFRVSPQASRWFGTRHLELDRGRATCAHLQHLTHKYW